MFQASALGPKLATGGTAELYAWEQGRVLKLYWEGAAQDAAEREAERTKAACAAGAPAPQVFDVVVVEERPGVVFERVEGPSMLQAIRQDPGAVERLAQQLAALHVDMHRQQANGLPSQSEHLIRRINLGPLPARTKPPVLAATRSLAAGHSLCHGDLHPGNVIMTEDGARIIDWFDATAGNPSADLARTCVLLQYGRLSGTTDAPALHTTEALRGQFLDAYLEHYRRLSPEAAAGLSEWFLPVAGARIAEPIPAQERTTLLRVIDSLLGQG